MHCGRLAGMSASMADLTEDRLDELAEHAVGRLAVWVSASTVYGLIAAARERNQLRARIVELETSLSARGGKRTEQEIADAWRKRWG